jgi:hypothetical protein
MLIQTSLELTLLHQSRAARVRSGLCEGATIDKTAFENRAPAFVVQIDDEWLEAEEGASNGSQAMLAVALTALLLAILPALIGLAILLGTTVPLEFGAGAAIAILGGIKLVAGGSGLVAAIREPRQSFLSTSNL